MVQYPEENKYNEKIGRGLVLFLREEYGITALYAELAESDVETQSFGGCDTCGWDEDTITTDIVYKTEKVGGYGTKAIQGSSLDFLPKLLKYIDRAN